MVGEGGQGDPQEACGRIPAGDTGGCTRVRFLTRCDGKLREPFMWRQGSQVSMYVARGSALLLSSHGRGCLLANGVPTRAK